MNAVFKSKRWCKFNIIHVPCSKVMIYNLLEDGRTRSKHVTGLPHVVYHCI